MSIDHTITIKTASSESSSISSSYTETGTTEISIDQSFSASTTDSLVSLSFTTSNIQSIELVSTQAMTIQTNSGSTPDNTITLVANVPFQWSRTPGYFSNPFTANVTAFYITCTAAARLTGRILKS